MPDIYKQAEAARRAVLVHDARTAREIVKAYKGVLKNLDAEFRNLHRQISSALLSGEPLRLPWLWERGDRLKALETQIQAEIIKFSAIAAGIVTDAQSEAVELGQTHARKLIQAEGKGISTQAGINVGSRLNQGAVLATVGFASDGSPLSDLFNALGPIAAKKVREKLIAGVALGWGADKIAREMKDAFNGNLGRALTVARTETLRAYRESSFQTYRDNSDVVEGWVWMSARTTRTCAMCWAMHGNFHSLDERLASHPNCRCFMLPLVKDSKQKIQNGELLFAKLPAKQQKEILGPLKFAAYQKGKLRLTDLVGQQQDNRWGLVRFERTMKQITNNQFSNTVQIFPNMKSPDDNQQQSQSSIQIPDYVQSTTPAGIVISQRLKLKTQDARVVDALRIIDGVHGDGDLPTIPIAERALQRRIGGYKIVGNKPKEIDFHSTNDKLEETIIHEVGHFLDHQALDKKGEIASQKGRLLSAWRRIVENSDAVKKLEELKKTNVVEVGFADGTTIKMPTNKAFVSYLLERKEIFGRAYSQYIAFKSGDENLLRQINDMRHNEGDPYRWQFWEDDDFRLIYEEFESLFKKKGWLQ